MPNYPLLFHIILQNILYHKELTKVKHPTMEKAMETMETQPKPQRHAPIYETVTERLFHPDIGYYTAYGIVARHPQSGRVLEVIKDVSTSKEEISEFIERLNSGELELIHLYDVTYDFILR